jgi:hypothetical protein
VLCKHPDGQLGGQARLAHTGCTCDGHQSALSLQASELLQLTFTAHKARELDPEVIRRPSVCGHEQ